MLAAHAGSCSCDDVGYLNWRQPPRLGHTLMRGFTTVRDVGGPSFGLQARHRRGHRRRSAHNPAGPYQPSPAVTADFRQRHVSCLASRRSLVAPGEDRSRSCIADSPIECACACVKHDFCQARVAVSSFDERAAGRGLTHQSPRALLPSRSPSCAPPCEPRSESVVHLYAHACTPHARTRSSAPSAAGVKCIEHGLLMDEATAKLIADARHSWLSLEQRFPTNWPRRFRQVARARQCASRCSLRTDKTFDAGEQVDGSPVLPEAGAAPYGDGYCRLRRVGNPRETLAWRPDYRRCSCWLMLREHAIPTCPGNARIVVEDGAAWLIFCWSTGDPIADIKLIEDPAQDFVVIMKDAEDLQEQSLEPLNTSKPRPRAGLPH